MRTFATIALLAAMGATTARADFLIDNFDTPTQGAHNSDGTTLDIDSPPNFFSKRTNNGSATSNLSVTNSNLAAAIQGGESAYLEWSNSASTKTAAGRLILQNFNGTAVNGVSYNVTVNGNSISGGAQQMTNGHFFVSATNIGPTDVLRITFSVATDGLAVFQGSGMIATPEPAAVSLLGLAMFGGACRYRRRRVTC